MPEIPEYLIALAIVLILAVFFVLVFSLRSVETITEETSSDDKTESAKTKPDKTKKSQALIDSNDGEVVAAITAAVCAYGMANGKDYAVKSITPLSRIQKRKSAVNVWAQAGRIENACG